MSFGPAARRKIAEVARTARRHGHERIIVLSGTAGTGKTAFGLVAAGRVAKHPLLVTQIQFHQSYTYEDFVEGLRPTVNGGFVPQPGIFLEVNEQALRDPGNRYVLLVEEFTRANIANVLGELMTYLEHRDRRFVTPITRQQVNVAPNLVVIATMNPRDRSALEVDDAIIRRLRIIDCPPDSNQLREMLAGRSLKPGTVDALAKMFDDLRAEHGEQRFNNLMPFGHGVFAEVQTERDLKSLWDQQIRHLLHRPLAPSHPFASRIEALYPRG